MCEPVSIGLALGASASTAAAVGVAAYAGIGSVALQAYGANKTADAQNKATQQATDAATQTAATNKASATAAADLADQANNRANGKQPDVAGLSSQNALNAKGGISGTMLTGPQGVDPQTLLLGKTTLLGG